MAGEMYDEERSMPDAAQYDVIILGSGQAANPLAGALARAGRSVALVEKIHVGGTCVNEGCTPTKTMVASGRVAHLARRGADYGVHTGGLTIDLKRVRERKRAIVDLFRSGGERGLKDAKNVDVLYGEGSFTGQKTLRVQLNSGGEKTLTAPVIYLNTGLRNAVPAIAGIGDVPYLDNISVMELDAVPEHLLVLGGGYIGLEFGQLFRRFGSRVTIVQAGAQLLNNEDADVADEVKKILEEDGLEVLLNAKARSAAKDGADVILEVETAEGVKTVRGSHLLLAAGRRPNTDTLNLSAAGVDTDEHGFVRVNEFLETTAKGIYALGDVKGGPAFTHISYDDYRIARANLLDGKRASTKDRLVPYAVFMDPQLGRIGLTEQEARRQGRKIQIAKMPMSYVARALETDETRGLMKIVVDAETKLILGAAVLGIEGGEIASQLQIAMMGGLPYTALENAVFAHPTIAESLNNVWKYLQ